MSCSKASLAPGDSTACTGQIAAPAKDGGYVFGVGVSGTDASSGDPVQAAARVYFTAGATSGPGMGPGSGQGVGGSTGSNGSDSQTGLTGGGSGSYGSGPYGSYGGYGQVGSVPQGGVHAGYGPVDHSTSELWSLAGGAFALLAAFGLLVLRRRYLSTAAASGVRQ